MNKKFRKLFKTAAALSFYLFIFIFPWQTKLIIQPAASNFNEISFYASHGLLLLSLIFFLIFKSKHCRLRDRNAWLWGALAGLELFIIISFFFATDQFLAFYHYLIFLVGVGLLFLLREETAEDDYEESCLSRIKVIYSFLAGVFLQALIGIYQFLTQTSFAFKYLGLAMHDPQALGSSVIETVSGRWLRAYGGFDHPNIFAGVLVIGLILAAYLLAKKKVLDSRTEVMESIFLFIFYFVSLFALFFTFSRAGWIAFGVGLLWLLVSLMIRRDRWILGRFLALMFFSAIMAIIVVYPYRELLQTRVNGVGRLEERSWQERWTYMYQAKDIISDHWIFGVGIGNYTKVVEERAVAQEEKINNPWQYQPVHNVFLLLWSQSGIFALISFGLFLFFVIKKDRRSVFPAAIFGALLVLMLFDHWLLSLPFGLLFMFFVLGLI